MAGRDGRCGRRGRGQGAAVVAHGQAGHGSRTGGHGRELGLQAHEVHGVLHRGRGVAAGLRTGRGRVAVLLVAGRAVPFAAVLLLVLLLGEHAGAVAGREGAVAGLEGAVAGREELVGEVAGVGGGLLGHGRLSVLELRSRGVFSRGCLVPAGGRCGVGREMHSVGIEGVHGRPGLSFVRAHLGSHESAGVDGCRVVGHSVGHDGLVGLDRRLGLASGPVLVVGVQSHVLLAQSLRLVDERPLLVLVQLLPLDPQPLADLGVVHFGVVQRDLASLGPGPHHERVHGPPYPLLGCDGGRVPVAALERVSAVDHLLHLVLVADHVVHGRNLHHWIVVHHF